jgi:hypothetical protein
MARVFVRDTSGYRWRSTVTFDERHYYEDADDIPSTDQEWVEWRLARWPGFGQLPYATLITGDLGTALQDGDYSDYEAYTDDNGRRRFTVNVAVACTSVNARNRANPLTANNILLASYSNVSLGGHILDNKYILDHLSGGYDDDE